MRAMPAEIWDPAAQYRQHRVAHWDRIAKQRDQIHSLGGYYHDRIKQIYQNAVPPDASVLEIGCGEGDLLASLRPASGVGVDFSHEMIERARARHPHLRFELADAHNLSEIEGPFDFIVLSDILNDLWDVQRAIAQLALLTHPRTRILLNVYSHLWEWPLRLAERLGVSTPKLEQNWLTVEDVIGLLDLEDIETLRTWREIVLPLRVPGLNAIANRVLVKLWPFSMFAMTNFIVARPRQERRRDAKVSIIVPARNESGNIAEIFRRTPKMGSRTELIFVEGHSRDDTYDVIARAIRDNPDWPAMLLRQEGEGKGDAVRCGFAAASGDILMILDADLTVAPEDLPRFYEALIAGRTDMAIGVRLVYPREDEAIRFFNLVGNKFFSIAFSWLLGQSIKDTLCGTKVLWRDDYLRIAINRTVFGEFDPFGDFDLIFGAARLNLKIVGMPVRYKNRTYGETNIRRWHHGWMLLKMLPYAARHVKFI
jgi:SAM-dependent methyltransferase